jgi:8-oxo-dGTP pyrophosphatase MutT (NUDIX family)
MAEDESPAGKRAAVAAILRASPIEAGESELLFIQRAEREGDPWSGHIGFPGGNRDEGDETLVATAIRETREEVGIDLAEHGRLLARLPDLPAIARGRHLGMIIAPFVFALEAPAEVVPNEEVAGAIWAPLGPLARGVGAGTFVYVHEGSPLELPCIHLGDRLLWGLTHRMLGMLLSALREGA